MAWTVLPPATAQKVSDALQPTMLDLIDLHLVGKQAHWTVVGDNFQPVHERLDVLIDAWRLWSDSVAERIVILGALPKGRAQDIVGEGVGDEIPVAWLDGAEAMSYLAGRVELAAKRAREHQQAIEDLDVISDGLLQTIVERTRIETFGDAIRFTTDDGDSWTDIDGDTLTVASVSGAVNGTVVLDDKGDLDATNDEVIFTPDAGYDGPRRRMVERLRERGIKDPRVLAAFRTVPRHLFVSEALRDQAYGDYPLPIGEQQTISQPYIVAEMTQALALCKDDRVLEIGTGSGYQAAVLAEIVFRVYTIERIRALYIQARKLLDRLNYHNIIMRCSDGTTGWQDESPFDAIMVTAGAPEVPEKLLDQLATGGRMIVPVGNQHSQDLIKITKDKDGIHRSNLGGCRFVKLIGAQGWKENR